MHISKGGFSVTLLPPPRRLAPSLGLGTTWVRQPRSGGCHDPTAATKCNERPSQATAKPVGGKACSPTMMVYCAINPTFSSSLKFAYFQGSLSRHITPPPPPPRRLVPSLGLGTTWVRQPRSGLSIGTFHSNVSQTASINYNHQLDSLEARMKQMEVNMFQNLFLMTMNNSQIGVQLQNHAQTVQNIQLQRMSNENSVGSGLVHRNLYCGCTQGQVIRPQHVSQNSVYENGNCMWSKPQRIHST